MTPPAGLRIAIVNQPFDVVLPPGQNSIGIWTYQVAPVLARHHDVHVFTGPAPGSRSLRGSVAEHDGVAYHSTFAAPQRVWGRISALWERLLGPRRPIYASVLYYLEFSLLVALRLRALRPDIVHIHNMTCFVPLVRLLNRR